MPLDSLRGDAIFGWRQLKKNKITSAAAILSLALAVGTCASAFRLIDALLLRPLPVANPERLRVVAFEGFGVDGRAMTYDSCSYPMFRQMRVAVKDQAESIGAQPGGIARLVTVDIFSMALAGALAGLALIAVPSMTILAAALLAALPAVIHAVRIDPVTMLRAE